MMIHFQATLVHNNMLMKSMKMDRGDYEECITLSFEDVTKGREIGLLKIDCEEFEYDFLIGKDLSRLNSS